MVENADEQEREAKLVALDGGGTRGFLRAWLQGAAVVIVIRVMVGAVVMLAEAVTFDRERRIDIIDDNIAVGIVMVELQHRAEHEHSHHAKRHYGKPLFHQPTKLQSFRQFSKQINYIVTIKSAKGEF